MGKRGAGASVNSYPVLVTRAPLTKATSWGFRTTELLRVLRNWKSKIKVDALSGDGWFTFWFINDAFSLGPPLVQEGMGIFFFPVRTQTLFMKLPPSEPNHLPMARLPDTITLGTRISTYRSVRRNFNTQTIEPPVPTHCSNQSVVLLTPLFFTIKGIAYSAHHCPILLNLHIWVSNRNENKFL